MELYTNSIDRKVTLSLPVEPEDGVVNATIRKAGATDFTTSATAEEPGVFSVNAPFYMTQEDGRLQIDWSFEYVENASTYSFSRTDYIDVVTPYISMDDIASITEGEEAVDVAQLERSVRHIINAHTGQSFGRYTGVKTIRGAGDSYLRLPDRLIRFTSVVGFPYPYDLLITGGGWYLSLPTGGMLVPPIRADFDGVNSGSHLEGPITVPAWLTTRGAFFSQKQVYQIDGTWGWESVPEAVRESARLLINDIASGDTIYRDRYLTSMTAADWRIQFHEGAFTNTGNARADALLADYVLKRGWAVV